MRQKKSFFLYIYGDLCGNIEYNKLGVGMTPYSVLRSRQKSCSERISLDYLLFGLPDQILFLEDKFKKKYNHLTGTILNGIPSQTELFKMKKEDMFNSIMEFNDEYKLNIVFLNMPVPYSAVNSGECPLGIPSERKSFEFLIEKANLLPFINTNVLTDLNIESNIVTYETRT
jgi:hypothetical protein